MNQKSLLTKFLFFLSIFLVLSINSYSLEDNYLEEFYCGDNVCNVGENTLNCNVDCDVKSIEYKIKYDTSKPYLSIFNGSISRVEIFLKNVDTKSINVSIDYDPILQLFLSQEDKQKTYYELDVNESKTVVLDLFIPEKLEGIAFNKDFYSTIILKTSTSEVVSFPLKVRIFPNLDFTLIEMAFFTEDVDVMQDYVLHLNFAQFNKFYSSSKIEVFLEIEDLEKNVTIGNVTFEDEGEEFFVSFYDFDFWKENDFNEGSHTLKANFLIDGKEYSREIIFHFSPTFWTEDRILFLIVLLTILFFGGSFLYSYLKYMYYKRKKSKYILPNMRKLPKKNDRAIWLGTVGGTNKPAYLNVDDLLTHALVAGSTGAGKSVTSSILVEEVLDKNIPVVVFDPTAQWTGFLGSNKDEKILKFFANFNMSENDVKSYKGIIYDVKTPEIELDFKDYMNPGEITVFNLASLKPGQYDIAVQKIVDTIFQMTWEESPEMKMFIVFDEVHRLLEKYGGSGGYVALEKAVREFRKWGIGMLMVSQVSADFKEALQGNVLTELQLNTKSMADINKAKSKYGDIYAERITRMNIGTGLIQNPHYNDGRPWFVNVRPPVHDPHKLSDELLDKYTKYSEYLKQVTKYIEALKAKGVDIDDVSMDLKLAKNKLKEGRFRMVEIYIESLQEFMKKQQGK